MKKTIFNGDSLGSPGIIYGAEEREDIFLGIHFGFSVVHEHERGLGVMRHELGVPHKLVPENFGLKMYKTTEFPRERFFFEKGETHTCLTFESGVEPLKGWGNEELDNNPECIATAWDEKSFGIVVPNQHFKEIDELYKAFERKDVLIQLNVDRTYIVFPHPYLLVSILSHVKSGEEERAFQAHKELYEKELRASV